MSPVLEQITPQPATEAFGQQRQQCRPHPRAHVTSIAIRRIVVNRKTPLRRVRDQLGVSKRQQRPHEPAASPGRDTGETGGRAAAQRAQHDGFDLIVLVMRRDDVLRPAAPLHLAQPAVARTPGSRLAGIRAELEFGELEGQPVFFGERSDRPSNHPTVRRDSVIDMSNHKRQAQLGDDAVQQIEQRHRIRTT